MKSILALLIALALPTFVSAQESRSQTRRAPAQNARVAQTAQVARSTDRIAEPVGLAQNVTFTIKGTLQGLVPVDLELTGCGPEFRTDFNVAKAPDSDLPAPIMTIKVFLKETAGGYHVEYSMGARVAQVASVNNGPGGTTKTIAFRDLSLNGSARVKLGKPLVVSKIDGKSLEITVSEAK